MIIYLSINKYKLKEIYKIIIIMDKMKSYPINWIDIKYCKYNDPDLLEALEKCIRCHKIPLPAYKSRQNLELSYCRNCYEKEYLDPQNLTQPPKGQEFYWKN